MGEKNVETRQHLIEWIDIFLKDGIVLNVVNPKAIKANYILKSKVKDKIEELKEKPLTINENNKYYYETDAYNKIIIQVLQELLESEGK